MGCFVADKKKIIHIVEDDKPAFKVSLQVEVSKPNKITEMDYQECKFEKVRSQSYISNTNSKKRNKNVTKSFVESNRLNRSGISVSSNKSYNTKPRRNTLLPIDQESGDEKEMTPFDMVNKNLYLDLIEFTLMASTVKFAKWFPYVTIPGRELAIYTKGKWTIDESKTFVTSLGYPGQDAGNLIVKRLGEVEQLPVNDLNNKIVNTSKVPLLLGFNMGKFMDYNPAGYLQIKLLGCVKVNPEMALPKYLELCTSLSLQFDNEVNEEIKQVLYFLDSFRTGTNSYFAKYRTTEENLNSLEYNVELSEMATIFMNANTRGNLSEQFKENSKKTMNISNRLEYISASYRNGHDSPYLKMLKILENPKHIILLETDSLCKIGITIKAAKMAEIQLGILLTEV